MISSLLGAPQRKHVSRSLRYLKLTVTSDIAAMTLSYCLLLVFLLANVSSAAKKPNVGCTLRVPDRVKERMEPLNFHNRTIKIKPVSILMKIKILGVRDVPDSGGSYGVDVG